LPRIIGLKDAPANVTQPARLRPLVGTNFRLICGTMPWRWLIWRRAATGAFQ